jgi:type III secretion protein J
MTKFRCSAVIVLLSLLAACSGTPLYSALTEQQANEVMAELLHANIDADKMRAKGNDPVWTVSVATDQFDEAMRILKSAGLPHEAKANLGEIFKKEGFVSSALEEKARYIFGLEEGFEATIMAIDGVVSASVHIALPERDMVSEALRPARASVTILKEPGSNVEQQKANIISIVKNGIEGLENPDNITVIFFDAHQKPAAAAMASATGFSRRQLGTAVFAGIAMLGALGSAWIFARSRRAQN